MAEVPVHDVVQPPPILNVQWVSQPELLVDLFELLWRELPPAAWVYHRHNGVSGGSSDHHKRDY